jgi:hypothetical protein
VTALQFLPVPDLTSRSRCGISQASACSTPSEGAAPITCNRLRSLPMVPRCLRYGRRAEAQRSQPVAHPHRGTRSRSMQSLPRDGTRLLSSADTTVAVDTGPGSWSAHSKRTASVRSVAFTPTARDSGTTPRHAFGHNDGSRRCGYGKMTRSSLRPRLSISPWRRCQRRTRPRSLQHRPVLPGSSIAPTSREAGWRPDGSAAAA